MPEKELNPTPTTDEVRAYCYAVARPIDEAIKAALNGFDIPPHEKAIGLYACTLDAVDKVTQSACKAGELGTALAARRLCTELADMISGIAHSAIVSGETATPYDVDAYTAALAEYDAKIAAQAAEVAAV